MAIIDSEDFEGLDDDSIQFLTADEPSELSMDRGVREEEPEERWYDERTTVEGDE